MKYSLGLWLALCLAGLQLVAVSIVVWSSYLTSERVLLDHARGLLSDAGANTTVHSKGFLNPARSAAELAARLAENEIVSSENKQQLEMLLFQQLQSAPQFAGIFYGDEAGNFVYVNRSAARAPFRSKLITHNDGERRTELIWRNADFSTVIQRLDPADKYDPRVRPWYETAKAAKGSIWTDPYIFFTSQKPGITIASPVIARDGSIQGVIGVDIEIDAISEFLADLKIGESGTALIVNRNGDVIAHPEPALFKSKGEDGRLQFVSIENIADPIAQRAFGEKSATMGLNVSQETYSKFMHDGESYVALVLPEISVELPWTIAVYAPERDFIGSIKENRALNIGIAGAVVVLTGLAGLLIANMLHRPVRAFSVRASLVSQGEIDPSEPMPKTYKELDQANEAMMQQIKQRKASEREYGLTFEMSSRGMAQMDPRTGAYLRVNEKLADMLGYDPEEMLSLTTADVTHPDDPMLSWNLANKGIEDYAVDLEKRCIRKDGGIIWVKINAIMIRDNEGRPLHAVATVDEITESRAAEVQIQKLSRDLSHLARGELLGQMAAGLAHELNQPLTAITQHVDAALLTVGDPKGKDAELVTILQDLDLQAHRAADTIRALRGFARKGEDWKAPFDLSELINHSMRLVRAEMTEHGINVTTQTQDVPTVSGIRVQIAQVIVNLLRNAIESIGDSGDNQKRITIAAEVGSKFVEVSVQDSGAGVDPDIDLFGQFETTKKEGMGLGLSICRSIVEAGGGKMWHDPSFTDGARFCFTVPIDA